MFEWKNEYAVNIGSIDAQHQMLFAIGRELYAAMRAGQGRLVLSKILDRLVEYTILHFTHEESLLRLHQYPNFASHKAEHDALTRKVVEFQADFNSGKIAMALEVLNFVQNWLQTHIKGSDFAYAACLKGKKVA
jgi:hemerythrin-like metal-binding protein